MTDDQFQQIITKLNDILHAIKMESSGATLSSIEGDVSSIRSELEDLTKKLAEK